MKSRFFLNFNFVVPIGSVFVPILYFFFLAKKVLAFKLIAVVALLILGKTGLTRVRTGTGSNKITITNGSLFGWLCCRTITEVVDVSLLSHVGTLWNFVPIYIYGGYTLAMYYCHVQFKEIIVVPSALKYLIWLLHQYHKDGFLEVYKGTRLLYLSDVHLTQERKPKISWEPYRQQHPPGWEMSPPPIEADTCVTLYSVYNIWFALVCEATTTACILEHLWLREIINSHTFWSAFLGVQFVAIYCTFVLGFAGRYRSFGYDEESNCVILKEHNWIISKVTKIPIENICMIGAPYHKGHPRWMLQIFTPTFSTLFAMCNPRGEFQETKRIFNEIKEISRKNGELAVYEAVHDVVGGDAAFLITQFLY